MTDRPGEGWKIFADGDEADNVPLWKVLAQFRSDDLDEGLRIATRIVGETTPALDSAVELVVLRYTDGPLYGVRVQEDV